MDKHRRTGRTTRMLEEAKRLSASGKAVYVIAANVREVVRLMEILGDDACGSIKVESPGTCRNFDWQTMSLLNAHPNCVTLVDHFAIESRWQAMLHELHAYDLKEANG